MDSATGVIGVDFGSHVRGMSFPFVLCIDGVRGIECDLRFDSNVTGSAVYKDSGSAVLVLR